MYRLVEYSMQESPSRPPKARSGELIAPAFYSERPAMMSSQRRATAPHITMMHPQHTRLYKAPQPTIRTLPDVSGRSTATGSSTTPSASTLNTHSLHNNSTESKTGARRRRQPSNTKPIPPMEPTTGIGFRGQALERTNSSNSLTEADLQSSGRGSKHDLFSSVPDGLMWKPTYSGPTPSDVGPRNGGGTSGSGAHVLLGDWSESSRGRHSGGAASHAGSLFVTDRPQPTRRVKQSTCSLWQCQVRSFFTPVHFLQLLALLCLTGVIYDSHKKVKVHRSRLERYDEERSHILEQMMWMDKAAKKVHASAAAKLTGSQADNMGAQEVVQENKRLQEQLERMQVRIQLNARDNIHERYSNKPITVTLRLKLAADAADGSNQDLQDYPITLELSDDTPHAVHVLLQQIDNGQWDSMLFETIKPGVVQVSSRSATGSPLLEFVEDSRSCSTAGSVALHEVVVDQLIHVLNIQIYLQDNAVLPKNAICIGRVSSGIDHLHQVPVARGNG